MKKNFEKFTKKKNPNFGHKNKIRPIKTSQDKIDYTRLVNDGVNLDDLDEMELDERE